jgi:hypothetical protein
VTNTGKLILFEPWNMGDALIAAAIALQDPARLTLACDSRRHSLIRAAIGSSSSLELLASNLDYVNRNRTGRLNFGSLSPISTSATNVASIRGDIRDYLAARKLFPGASIHTSGWLPFAARRSAILDLPYANQWLPIRNRYRAWASLASIPWQQIENFYAQKLPEPATPLITIHIGSQWRSKQYPHVARLAELLTRFSRVQIVGAPGDPLPIGVSEDEVLRPTDPELVEAFRISTQVIVNDSAPMHLAALLRCRTYSIVRMSAIAEWLPPATIPIEAMEPPRG